MSTLKASTGAQLNQVWLALSAITVAAWWFGSEHKHAALAAGAVLVLSVIKARLIIRYFMEVRSAPRWLRLVTDAWLVALWGAALVSYLW